MTSIYFDHHSTTPLDERVLHAMMPFLKGKFGNAASRQHGFGWEAEEAVSRGRKQLADLIGAEPKEIVFTSGATESNNLAIKGVAESYQSKGRHLISCVTEHPCVIESLKHLEKQGFTVTWITVDREGRIDPTEIQRTVTPQTILVSIMLANNEIGTIQSIKEISEIARANRILFHCDVAQAVGKISIDVKELGIDLASVSAHKFYGPKGIGALYVRSRNPRVKLTPQLDGGGHENGVRSGTLNVPGIVGMGKAADICREDFEKEVSNMRLLRNKLWDGIREVCILNGPSPHSEIADLPARLPNNLNVRVDGLTADSIMMAMKEYALSSGSACSSAIPEPSHVLRAIGLSPEESKSSLRIGLGRSNTMEEVDLFITRFRDVVGKLRTSELSHVAK